MKLKKYDLLLIFAISIDSVALPTELINDPKSGGKGKSRKLKSIGCDSTITFMHALGRALNPKCKLNHN